MSGNDPYVSNCRRNRGRLTCAIRLAKLPSHAKSSPRIPIGTKALIEIQPIQESVLHKWRRLVRALSAFAFLYAFCGFAGQPAYADGSVSSLRMGYGARNPAEFAQFQSVIQQYNASGERFRIDSHCQSACTMSFRYAMSASCRVLRCCFTLAAPGERASAPAARSKCSAPITQPCSSMSPPTISWTRSTFIRFQAVK